MLTQLPSDVALMAQTGPVEDISQFIGIDFFSIVLPWLLTFAIVYGVLSQLGGKEDGIPENDAARAIIGIVLAFIIAPALSPYIKQVAGLSAGFVALISGFLLVIIFTEVLGVKSNKEDNDGDRMSFFRAYPKFFGFVVAVLAVIVFIGSGGPQAMGIEIPPYIGQNYPLLFFLGFMVLVVWWMVDE